MISRTRSNPRRMHDLTVPNGILRRAAISACDRPSNTPSSITCRCSGLSSSSASLACSASIEVSGEVPGSDHTTDSSTSSEEYIGGSVLTLRSRSINRRRASIAIKRLSEPFVSSKRAACCQMWRKISWVALTPIASGCIIPAHPDHGSHAIGGQVRVPLQDIFH